MFLAFVIIIIITWLAILFSIYSIFNPFVNNFSDIVDYNIAYYGAMAWIERWELVLKYKWPWFQWSGGWLNDSSFGKASDLITWWFSIISWNNQWIVWNINSRTTRIPNMWEWNVDPALADASSVDYNKLDYNNVENFLLSVDNSTSGTYYSWNNTYRLNYSWTYISGVFRLPPKIFSGFANSNLCDDDTLNICDPDLDGLANDVIVNRSLKWYHLWNQFSIIPTENVAYYGVIKEVVDWDIMIRESNINALSGVIFGDNFNIFGNASDPLSHNVISNDNSVTGDSFQDIFEAVDYTWLQLRFGLVNLLNSMSGDIYPFLEYYFEFDNDIADRFFNIEWNWRRWNYDVKILIKKPTFEETIGGSFTVIF